MDKIIFFFLRFFRKSISALGADFDQVELIVSNKIKMDNRKSLNPNNTKKQLNYSLWIQYGMYLFYGILMSVIISQSNNPYTGFFITFTLLIFMLALNMIADFSTVLLDTRDNTIILPRPVSEKTYLLTRIIHIACYILGFSLAFSIVPFITICFKYNSLDALVFLINVLLSSLFSLFFTNLFYLSLMKITTGERFKDIIAYFQIFITFFLFVGYQFIIRLIDKTNSFSVDTSHWWIYLVPPSWMAASNEAFVHFEFSHFHIVSIGLSLCIPLIGIWLVTNILAPGYVNKLAILEQGDVKKRTKKNQDHKIALSTRLAALFTRSTLESTFFQIVWKIASRDRKFKQSVYPMLGGIAVFVVVIIFNNKGSMDQLGNSYMFLTTLYFPLFYLYIIITNLRYSDNYQSAWIYKVMPIDAPGEIVSATIKAISLKLFVPIYLLVNGIFIYYRGISFCIDMYIGFLLSIMITMIMLNLTKVNLPFTSNLSERIAGGNMMTSFLIMIVGACLAGIHYLLYFLKIPMYIPAITFTFIGWFVFRAFRKIGWDKIEAFNV